MIYIVNAHHPIAKYAAVDMPVKVGLVGGKYFASADAYGCGKDAASPEQAIVRLLQDHGCVDIRSRPAKKSQIVWSQRLANACAAVALEFKEAPHREALLKDVRSRAAEFAAQRVGQVMSAMQMEYFICLRSRLECSYLESHAELNAAWGEAYDAAEA